MKSTSSILRLTPRKDEEQRPSKKSSYEYFHCPEQNMKSTNIKVLTSSLVVTKGYYLVDTKIVSNSSSLLISQPVQVNIF